ncbi:MAG: DUF5686 and carboxypeptidase regulatory-like domain-containing protein [Cyclobacteriaceae bacterium]|nr:DUF5686 and carboxypeptidase regulatory-like domain-containing protein [Cyclobacteriaceae bacterium]
MRQFFFLILLTGIELSLLHAQGIRGKITTPNGNPLSFATIYVRNLETGTASNIDGDYEIRVNSGKYDVVYQYLGYKTVIKVVEVGTEFITQNITLKPQNIVLQEVVIKAGKEDPAYTIMRKAIAKAKYHANQLDGYRAKVYMKGAGRLKDSPWFLRKQIAKEGIDSTMAFVTESLTEVIYTRPNKFEENVISIRTSGDDNNTNPMQYINGSFYEPKVVDAISPLSPRAFSYYKFRYDGSFTERGYTISKIRVIPRINGDNLFRGDLFLIEDYWSIYSLDFTVSVFGIEIDLKQVCEPIEDKVWMPITHKFYVDGTFLGFDFEYDYLATLSGYDIRLNPDLDTNIEVIDEKVEKELATEIHNDIKKSKNAAAIERLTQGDEITRKDLRKVMREYEKEEWKEEFEEPNIIGERTLKYDSTAYEQDSTYWAKIRPVPLSKHENKGYKVIDSLANVQRNEKEGDTLKVTKRGGFKIYDLLLGNTYKVGDKTHLNINSVLENTNFNTVEGYNMDYSLSITKTFENKHWIKLSPLVRYSIARNQFAGKIMLEYKIGDPLKKRRITIQASGGKYVSQINQNNEMTSISQYNSEQGMIPLLNTFTTLMLESNYMKIYEKDFAELNISRKLGDKITFNIGMSWEDRIPLFNNTNHTWIPWNDRVYTQNESTHVTETSTAFSRHRATVINAKFHFEPWLKYRIYNGRKRAVRNSSPLITTSVTSTINAFESEVKFMHFQTTINHRFDVGVRGVLSYNIGVGGFLQKDSLSFIDYLHFQGNLSPFTKADPVKEYRIMDYYRYSSNDNYLSILLNHQFGKLVVTQIPWVYKQGIRENVFVNYLGTESINDYVEIGYSWNYIYRVFKIEGVASFENGKYKDWGIRIGIAAGLDDIFSFN